MYVVADQTLKLPRSYSFTNYPADMSAFSHALRLTKQCNYPLLKQYLAGATSKVTTAVVLASNKRYASQSKSANSPAKGKKNTHNESPSTFGIAFDVDGVLLRGPNSIAGAKEALTELDERKIPWVLLTNGGGYLEVDKARQISKVIGHPVDPEQVQLAHTPFKALAKEYRTKPVLLVGKSQIHKIARGYGFENTYDISDLHHQWPSLFPDWKPVAKSNEFELSDTGSSKNKALNEPNEGGSRSALPKVLTEPLACVLVFMDPLYYHRDLQILLDVLRSSDGWPVPSTSNAAGAAAVATTTTTTTTTTVGKDGATLSVTSSQAVTTPITSILTPSSAVMPSSPSLILPSAVPTHFALSAPHRPEGGIPVFFAGPDLEYVTEHPLPRLGAGIFGDCVAHLYQRTTGRALTREFCGKPYIRSYAFARDILNERARSMGYAEGIRKVYAIGDNPASDIRGANGAGWMSILVRTGMFQSVENDPHDPAHFVVNDVYEAVSKVLEVELSSPQNPTSLASRVSSSSNAPTEFASSSFTSSL